MSVGYKGKTIIELKDVNTKKVQRVEHENTFQTTVLEQLFKPRGAMGISLVSYGANQWQSLVGGILVFDKQITVGTQYPPQNVNMTANGCYNFTNNTDPVEMGTWNATESYVTKDEIVMTYDWSTSQGNGTINSVCLTSYNGGKGGTGNASKTQIPDRNSRPKLHIGGTYIPNPTSGGRHFYCADGVYFYDIVITSTTVLTVNRRWANMSGVDLIKGANVTTYDDVYTITLPTGYSVDAYTLPFHISETKFAIGKDNDDSYSVRTVNVANRDISNEVIVPKRSRYMWYVGGTNKLQVAQAYTDNDVDYIGIYDTESEQWISETVRNIWPNRIFYIGNRLYFEGSSAEIYCDCNGELVPTNSYWLNTSGNYNAYGTYLPNLDILQFGSDFSEWDRELGRPSIYLATINNLEEEIIKDNTKTMKITYVLTRGA